MIGTRLPICVALLLSAWATVLAQDIPLRHVVIDADGPVAPWGKAVGDLDGDDRPDLIVGGRQSGGLVWYRNPSWARHTIAAEGHWSTDHEAVDVDGDGDVDVVSLTLESLCWYENPSWQEHRIDQRGLHDIEVADFDRDGDVDVVARGQSHFGQSGATLHLYRQEAPGRWTHQERECPDGEGLVVGDVDRDGDPDIVVTPIWFENVGAFTDDGWRAHPFTDGWDHPSTFEALADVNRDGRVDIVLSPSEIAGERYRISWFEAPRSPTTEGWAEHVIDADVEAVHHFVGAADLDLDGDVDVVTAEMEQGVDPDEVKVYRNDGDEDTWVRQVLATTGSHSMRLLDVDGDGDTDLFGANWNGHTVDLWVNDTRRPPLLSLDAWTHLTLDGQRPAPQFGLGWGDVDADGDLDVVAGSFLYHNPGGDMSAAWARTTLPDSVDAGCLLDVDGDDQADILAQALPDLVWLEATDATGTAFTGTRVASGLDVTGHGSSQGSTLGDLTGSQTPEYVLTDGDGIDYVIISPARAEGPWPVVHITDEAPEEGLAVGDVDGDGLNDVAAWIGSGSGSLQLAWWRNPGTGAGDWEPTVIGAVDGTEGDRVAVGDLDLDGRLDVAATGTTNGADGSGLYWFANPGAQAASTGWRRATIGADLGAMNSMSVADMDRDGALDVISGEHRGAKRVVVWRNVGAGTQWAPHQVDQGRESHLGAQVADLDQDGDLDIVSVAWDEFPLLHLWRNDAVPRGPSRIRR